ncbi:MAG: response regulator [Bacteroidales bacterium]|nr:response regulator [Bacteroidales bacterium]
MSTRSKIWKVLLIEDKPGDAVLFQNYLAAIEGMTCELSVVGKFAEASDLLKNNSYNIIFTNLNLPDSNGLNTLSSIINHKSDCPVVVITGFNDKDAGLRAINMGAEDYLFKSELNSFIIEKSIVYSIERKRLIHQLRESETRFRRMFEYSSIGIFRSTSDGRLLEVNQAFADIFGYVNPEDALKTIKNIALQLYPNPSIRYQIMEDFEKNKVVFKQLEVDFLRKDGSLFNGLLHMRRIDDEATGIFIVEGFVQNISDQKKADRQLKENLQFLKNLMDNIPSPVFSKDIELRYTGCNIEFEKYIGFTEKELIGKTISEVRFDDSAEFFHQMDQKLFETGEKQQFEHKLKFANGETRDVVFHKNVIKDPYGNVTGIIGLILDITDKKLALEKLQEELSLNEAMTELSKQLLKPGISISEISHLILEFSRELTQSQHGYAGTIDEKNEDLILHTFTEMVNSGCKINFRNLRFSKINDKYPKLWGHALNTLHSFFTNSPQTHKASGGTPTGHLPLHNFLTVPAIINGRLVGQIALANSSHPYDNDDLDGVKKLTNLFSIAIEKQRSIEEMIKAREKAELSDKLKSAFLANMSHEIRTPLNAIVGFAQMLGEEGIGLEETHEFKAVIIKNTDVLLRLISDIIEMAMIEAGELKIHSENRAVGETMNQILQIWMMSSEVSENIEKIKFTFEAPSTKSSNNIFKIDSLRFSQIIDNLLMNAFRFTRVGEITLGYHFNIDNHVVIFVKDTGVGISKEDQTTIFDRFRQVDELKVRPFSGTGLGLAITKKLVEHLSGEIWVDSEIGKGSTFFIKFPLEFGKASVQSSVILEETTTLKIVNEPSLVSKHILVVEDNDSSFDFLEILLKRKAAVVYRAVNGKEAVEKTLSNNYDMVLMDLQLPEMSGFDAIKTIRLTDKEIPIIVQTAFSEQNERDKAFEAGCNFYLIKPITKRKLEDALLKFC